MAKQTKQLIEETQTGLKELEQQLESAKEVRDEYNRELKNARARLKRKENTTYPDKLALEYVKQLKIGNELEIILINWIDKAAIINEEFQQRSYLAPLYEVAKEKDIYLLTVKGTGWAVEIDAQIIFEQEAGTLGDWGEAVRDYREFELQSRGLESEKAGAKATDWWYTHVYDTNLGDKTIKGRLNYTPTKAPYWQILNNGSPPSMVSDRPGTHNPVPATSTLFIEDAELEIEYGFRTKRIEEQGVWQEETNELKKAIEQFEKQRDEYSRDVRDLRTEFSLNQRIYNDFGDKAKFINQHKMIDVIRRARAGEEFENPKVNIGIRGHRLYLNIKKVEGDIELEYG